MATAPDAQVIAEKAKAGPVPPREYVIFLEEHNEGHRAAWVEVGRATAQTRDEALDQVVDTLDADEQDGPFVAVAARYWQPTAPVVEVKTTRSWR